MESAALRILYLCDFRAPTPRNWISYFVRQGHEVHVITSYPCSPITPAPASLHTVPIAFSGRTVAFQSAQGAGVSAGGGRKRSLLAPLVGQLRSGLLGDVARALMISIGPVELLRRVGRVRALIEEIQPDLFHAMRIPLEAILATRAVPPDLPYLVSTWGNDFTLFARYYPLIGRETRRAMNRADAVQSDCHRDLRLARRWGFAEPKPGLVVPGVGGLQFEVFHPGPASPATHALADVSPGAPVIVNPRLWRGYMRHDTFFRAIPEVLRRHPEAVFLGIGMQGVPKAERWVRKLGIERSVRLLPKVDREQLADLFRLSRVVVSPSPHDGTPNSLLEGMACGCFPVAGDIESVREWIVDGENGLLFDCADPRALSAAILRLLDDESLRRRAFEANLGLIAERADYRKVMGEVEAFYHRVAAGRSPAEDRRPIARS
jgi:glycosyltransferase involved in cell wall biosynthesis